MHELSVMTVLVEELLDQLSKYKVERVEEVVLEVGDLTFLGEEQMNFAWGIVCEENEILKGAKLTMERVPADVKCKKCGYEGELKLADEPSFHRMIMKFACPECENEVEIVRGRDCIIKNVSAEVEE